MYTTYIAVLLFVVTCTAQRPPYAGRNPNVRPTTVDPLGNRFGDDTPSTTVRLPIEVLGDVELYNRLLKLPTDRQPYWLLNWIALEANRNQPQTFNQRGNNFIDTPAKEPIDTTATKE